MSESELVIFCLGLILGSVILRFYEMWQESREIYRAYKEQEANANSMEQEGGVMGSFGEYLESLKYTPEYACAKVESEVTDAIFKQMQAQGVTEKELARRVSITEQEISDILSGDVPLFGLEIVRIAHALNCDLKIELVPKPIPGKNYTLPDDLNADGTVKYKPLPNELNADGTIKRGAWK